VAWKEQTYRVRIIQATAQMVHYKATQMTTQKQFAITFVYGANNIIERQSLWAVLNYIASSAQGPWCVMGDFHAVLSLRDSIGGDAVQHGEIQDFATCLQECKLQEVTSNGAYFTWTNKWVWSRIDRVVANNRWYQAMGFTQVSCLAEGLSDHTPVRLLFPSMPS